MSQQEEKQKVKIDLESSDIPEKEIEDLTSVYKSITDESEIKKKIEGIWQASGEGFSNAAWDGIRYVAPTFYTIVTDLLSKKENADKKVSFSLKNCQLGVSMRQGFKVLWRRKTGDASGNKSSGWKSQPAQPLEELFFDSVALVNKKLAENKNEKWYFVKEFIQQNPSVTDIQSPDYLTCHVLIKRNTSFSSTSNSGTSS
jgi:hypothetical protein